MSPFLQAVGDILTHVDGVSVMGDTPDEVAHRIMGPEGQAITLRFKIKRKEDGGGVVVVDNVVTLLRQTPVTMPDQLIKPQVGLGVELGKLEGGLMDIRNLASGGTAMLGKKLMVGDIIFSVDGKDIRSMPDSSDKPAVLLGPPYSRVSLAISRSGRMVMLDLVRTVPLLGEYLLKHSHYSKAVAHAIVQPAPPLPHAQSLDPARPHGWQNAPVGASSASSRQATSFATSASTPNRGFNRMDMMSLDRKFERVMDVGGSSSPSNSVASPPVRDSPGYGASAGLSTSISSWRENSSTVEDSSVDGMISRSSTASRDSIALCVRQFFGEAYDALRTVEGREATFSDDWPHRGESWQHRHWTPALWCDGMRW